jgi:hypothetical protein
MKNKYQSIKTIDIPISIQKYRKMGIAQAPAALAAVP